MYKIMIGMLVTTFLSLSNGVLAESAPDSIKQLIPKLETWGSNAVLVNAVKSNNKKNVSLDDIKSIDSKWKSTTGVDSYMEEMMSNSAAEELKTLESSMSFLFECFLMGDKGENVAMTNKTSDYWQGDEAKFTKSFNGGSGQVHIGDVKFDDSAQVYQVQVSVPVKDGGKTIGAITIGIDLDAYEASL